jgi:hypothetical protein
LKLSHIGYGKGILTLKAAILAPTLSSLKTSIDTSLIAIPNDFKNDANIFLAALCIFTFDFLFNFLASKVNDWHISSRIKNIHEGIIKLESILSDDLTFNKKVTEKISKLKNEELSLIGN